MTTGTPGYQGRAGLYLVVVGEVLVAQDIAEMIREREPRARVLVAQDPQQALALLEGAEGWLTCVFRSDKPTHPGAAALGQALAARGGITVRLGDRPAQGNAVPAAGWLPLPFTTDAMFALLDRCLPGYNTCRG